MYCTRPSAYHRESETVALTVLSFAEVLHCGDLEGWPT